jgi:hypothetical protein
MTRPHISYSPNHEVTAEAEMAASAAIYKFVLFDSQASKGGPHDLTHDVATDGRKQKVQVKARKDRT